ncbi:agmatine deiminase family protein [Desulfolutivibrio sulfoxidireducens]|nr:agmatine deiminase family protein [Desulfolutivibrio sulfoxidireducens]
MSLTEKRIVKKQKRLVAEFDKQQAVWIGWPANRRDWPGKFAAVKWAFADMVRFLAEDQIVRLLVTSARHQAEAGRMLADVGANLGNVRFAPMDLDRNWTRDILPFFVRDEAGRLTAVRFAFNGWGKYPNHLKDAQAGRLAAAHLGLTLVEPCFHGRPVVLEGGAVDGNGRGDLLATEECLLDPAVQVRNPGMTRRDYESVLAEHLGVANVIWLRDGIAGDDTHGHVDDFCRFVSPDTLVLCREDNPGDPNHRILAENRERLESVRLASGAAPVIVELPMPGPVFHKSIRLPASYANFYIGNRTVLAPTFNDPNDRVALSILADCFPTRTVRGIHAVELAWGFGAVHCLTHEEPCA